MTEPQKRLTKQRQAVIDALADCNDFRSAQRIHEDLMKSSAKIGLATVYRNLRSLAEEKEVDVLMSPDGEALYRRCEQGEHHHHLVCRKCLRSEEIEATAVENWVHGLGEEYGFTQLEHSIEVFGICSHCVASDN
ncbi:Fur family transcriptional regulator [Gleimia coleocanis]|nr:transcriptional repressor [Gleimia coleocanis]